MGSTPEWLDPLIAEINAAAGSDPLAAIFDRLRTEHGSEEAGRRWWAAFGASDASAT
jgi:hypothetical protein